MKISIVIATFRRGKNLLLTLKDLKEINYTDFEIVVVDQTPKDEYHPQICEELRDLSESGFFRWIYYPRNYVYEARNYGAAISTGEFLLWLDDDVRVGSDLLDRFVRCLKENPGVSLIQGSAVSDDIFNDVSLNKTELDLQGKIDKAAKEKNEIRRNIQGKEVELLKLKPELQAFYCEGGFNRATKECSWISANNMLIKRSAFDSLCGWDEYILNYGDRNLGIRAAKAGFRIQWYPDAAIVHMRVPSGGSRMSDPKNPIKGWRTSVSTWYLAFKYLRTHPIAFYKFGIFKAARYSFLLKRNFLSPNSLVSSFFSYFLAAFIGLYWSLLNPVSSYPLWRREVLESNFRDLPLPNPVTRTPQ